MQDAVKYWNDFMQTGAPQAYLAYKLASQAEQKASALKDAQDDARKG